MAGGYFIMYDDYRVVETTYDVWKAIKNAHPELRVFGSCTEVERGYIFTSYGFPDSDYPIMQAETRFDWQWNESGGFDEQVNVEHKYWLCLPKKCEE